MKPVILKGVGTDFAVLFPCRKTRQVCQRGAKQVRNFLTRHEGLREAMAQHPDMVADWGDGLAALEKVAFIPSKSIHLTMEEARNAFTLVSALLIQRDLADWKPVLRCQSLFGMVIHCAFKPRELPLEKVVFMGLSPHPAALQLYQLLRTWEGPPTWEFSLALAALMRRALENTPSVSPDLVAFKAELDKVTSLWRFTQQVVLPRMRKTK